MNNNRISVGGIIMEKLSSKEGQLRAILDKEFKNIHEAVLPAEDLVFHYIKNEE